MRRHLVIKPKYQKNLLKQQRIINQVEYYLNQSYYQDFFSEYLAVKQREKKKESWTNFFKNLLKSKKDIAQLQRQIPPKVVQVILKITQGYKGQIFTNANMEQVQPLFLYNISHINFDNLIQLRIINSQLSSIQPLSWIRFNKLQQLNLRSNHIINLKPLPKVKFSSLNYLNIESNYFQFSQLKYLNKTDLNNSKGMEIFSLKRSQDLNHSYVNQSLLGYFGQDYLKQQVRKLSYVNDLVKLNIQSIKYTMNFIDIHQQKIQKAIQRRFMVDCLILMPLKIIL